MSTVSLTGADVLVRLLQAEGVRHAFGVVGGKLAPLLDALSRSDIAWTGVRHESAGPMMAAAVNAATGGLALAVGEMGPGQPEPGGRRRRGLQQPPGRAVRHHQPAPCRLLSAPRHVHGSGHACAVRSGDQVECRGARRAPPARAAAAGAARGADRPARARCTLDVPQDVLAARLDWPRAELDIGPSRYRAVHRPRPHAQAVAQAAALLARARQPLLLAGGGVIAADAVDALRELAARLSAPVTATQMALGVVPSDSPSFIGHGGLIAGPAMQQALTEADVVLAVGCRFSSWLWDEHGPLVRRAQTLINLNLDPSALGCPALHSVALHGDAKEGLQDLLAALPSSTATDPAWLPLLRQRRRDDEARLRAMADDGQVVMHPAALAAALGQALPRDALAVFDGGHTSFWSNDLTPVHAPRTRFHDPGISQLGYGLPYALALQKLHPGRCVVNITGDGSFGFTLQELDTARRERLPVVTVIHNNEAWGVIQAGQAKAGFDLGTSLAGTDYAAVARGFGAHGERVERAEDVGPALQRAIESRLPAVLDCRTRFVGHPAMPAFGSMNRYGFDALVPAG